jgi:hypothetical protein
MHEPQERYLEDSGIAYAWWKCDLNQKTETNPDRHTDTPSCLDGRGVSVAVAVWISFLLLVHIAFSPRTCYPANL